MVFYRSPMSNHAAILSIGDELVLGQTLDTNARLLAGRLMDRGVPCVEHATVADDRAAIARAIARLASIADLLIVTGGLGPTEDDLTRHGLADAMDDALVEDAGALEHVEAWFAGRAMPEANRIQALRPSRATIIPNPHGTAPGLQARIGTCDVFCLPGPPREMEPMFKAHVLPKLRPNRTVRTRFIRLHGLGESDVAERLGDLMSRDRNPLVGTTASRAIITCRLRYEGSADPASADRLLDETEADVLGRLQPYVFGTGDQTLPGTVLELLRQRKETTAVVESCTGGLLGALFTDIPGSSDAFVGGWITYTNEMKQDQVGVPGSIIDKHGAVSRECATAMAEGGLARSGADHCLAITGIAGPGGGSPDKPVGTVWIALASRNTTHHVQTRCFRFKAERTTVRDRSAKAALSMLRLHLIDRDDAPLLWQRPPRLDNPSHPADQRSI
jgi:nicotinamide-nucleotide amidase